MSMEQLIILAAMAVYALVRWLARQRQGAFAPPEEPDSSELSPAPPRFEPPPRAPVSPAVDGYPPAAPQGLQTQLHPAPPRAPTPLPQPQVPLEVIAARREREVMLRRLAERRARPAPRTATPPARTAPTVVDPSALGPAELRRAFVLMTILGPPRALDPPRALPPADHR